MGDLVQVRTRKTAVNESVVETLETVLAEAKAGQINAVAIAAVQVDGEGMTHWAKTDNRLALLGAMHILMERIARQ